MRLEALDVRTGVAAGSKLRRVTGHDVAKRAGVSQSAVSRCFREGASISPDLRERVVEAAEALGYRPNAIASAVSTRRSNVVAIVMYNETQRHYPEVLLELSGALSRLSLRLMLFTLESPDEISRIVDQIWSYQIDAVVAACAFPNDLIERFEAFAVPVVLYNRLPERGSGSAVSCHHRASGRMAAEHLLAAGHHEFLLIGGPAGSSVAQERLSGAMEALDAAPQTVMHRRSGDLSYDDGAHALRGAAEAKLRFTAVIASNDVMAFGAIDAAVHDLGLSVPDDMSIVGFDGVEAARWLSYRLTTVVQPLLVMAEATAAMIAERLRSDGSPPERRLYPGVLSSGATVGPPRSHR